MDMYYDWVDGEVLGVLNALLIQEFLDHVLLIGSDGGDVAYGIDAKGRFIEVPFIGMEDEAVQVIAEDFDSFVNHVWNKQEIGQDV